MEKNHCPRLHSVLKADEEDGAGRGKEATAAASGRWACATRRMGGGIPGTNFRRILGALRAVI